MKIQRVEVTKAENGFVLHCWWYDTSLTLIAKTWAEALQLLSNMEWTESETPIQKPQPVPGNFVTEASPR